MRSFASEFQTLSYILEQSSSVLLFAHTRPDVDTIGATLALAIFLENKKKRVSIACFDPFPPYLNTILPGEFLHPSQLDIAGVDAVIACDSVDRGFDRISPIIKPGQATVVIDHHPDIESSADVKIIDTQASSTCELLYRFFEFSHIPISKALATRLLAGIIFDTGNLQHACTTPRVMEIAGALMKKGAPLGKIVNTIFTNKSVSALRLWGKAFEQSVFYEKTGMLLTAVTRTDIEECAASVEDITMSLRY
ncbi:MAG: DHH family phosphoesterase [Candidatus Moraniibacteriota bacterium]|nr:MAG: DHH family phosphoesterase [Candidatus Moranbacteria bacterium]